MKLRKYAVCLFALLITCSLSMTAFAKEWTTEDFQLDIPEDFYIFTSENSPADPTWAEAGIEDPSKVLELFSKDERSVLDIVGGSSPSESLYGIASFISPDTQILLARNKTQASLQYGNSKDMTQQDKQDILDKLSGDGETTDFEANQTVEWYDVGNVPFLKLSIDVVGNEGEKMHEITYMTMLNRDSVTFHVYTIDKDISEKSKEALETVVNSFVVTNYTDFTESQLDTWEIVKVVGLLVVLIGIIVGTIIFSRVRTKKDQNQKKLMADKLSEFHRQNSGVDAKGKLCYANVTNCSDEAIHAFSIFQSYLKHLPSLIIGAVSCIVLVVVSILFSDEWFMILISAGVTIYFVFKTATASSNMEKVQKRIYARGSSNMAKYAFYDNIFRVTGVQAMSTYPYFQITDIRTYKEYIYLYYGPENAYIVSRNGFANDVDPDAFVEFVKAKIQEGLNDTKS